MATLDVLSSASVRLAAEDNSSDDLASRRSAAEQAELARIRDQIESAQTLAEITEVTAVLRAWVEQHLEEHTRLATVFEQLAMMEDSAMEAQSEAEAMRLTPEECQQRAELFALRRRVHAEDAPQAFAAALCKVREAMASWESLHPEDPYLPSLCVQLDTETYVAHALHETPKIEFV